MNKSNTVDDLKFNEKQLSESIENKLILDVITQCELIQYKQ